MEIQEIIGFSWSLWSPPLPPWLLRHCYYIFMNFIFLKELQMLSSKYNKTLLTLVLGDIIFWTNASPQELSYIKNAIVNSIFSKPADLQTNLDRPFCDHIIIPFFHEQLILGVVLDCCFQTWEKTSWKYSSGFST